MLYSSSLNRFFGSTARKENVMSAKRVCDMSPRNVCDMSCGAMHEFALALDKAGFTASLVQQVINSGGNKLARAMRAALTTGVVVDDRFELVDSFDVVVPDGYDHATRLGTFWREHGEEFDCYNPSITDENYSGATNKLVPGRGFRVKVFQIRGVVSSDDCLAHLRSQKAVLVGAQGASLAYEQGKNMLPVNRWSVSFDDKDALLEDPSGWHWVPDVLRHSDGSFRFNLGQFELNWNDGFCLLCFCGFEPESSGA